MKRLLIKVRMTWKRLAWDSKVSVTKLRTRGTSPVERESKGWEWWAMEWKLRSTAKSPCRLRVWEVTC